MPGCCVSLPSSSATASRVLLSPLLVNILRALYVHDLIMLKCNLMSQKYAFIKHLNKKCEHV